MNTLNIIGYSTTYSEVLSVLFAVEPNAPPAPKYVNRHGGDLSIGLSPYITISWQEPDEDGGAPILGYFIEASIFGGPFNLIFDSSSDPQTKQKQLLDLVQGARYQFRVFSRNIVGRSLTPSPAVEIYAAIYPYKMDKLKLGVVVPNGDQSTLEVRWDDNLFTGGSAVLGYYLQRNSGYKSSLIEPGELIPFGVNSFVFTNLLEGVNYKFRIAAFNVLKDSNKFLPDDYLHFSDPVEFYVANLPGKITVFSQPTTGYISGTVNLVWQQPLTNGSPIIKYVLQRDVGVGVFFTIWEG